jgi:hypothetical protein
MFWHEVSGRTYLIRKSDKGNQTSIGLKSDETEAIYNRFTSRKASAQERYKSLRAALELQQRVNKATRVGRVPSVVIAVLNEISNAGLEDHFTVVGTNALFAYETRCGVRISADAMVTEDVDLFFHAQKHLKFLSLLDRSDVKLLEILRKADKTFQIRSDQLYTVMNDQGYQVDFIRRPSKPGDTHPMKMANARDDEAIWSVQVPGGEALESSKKFDQIVAGTNGALAKMRTIAPDDFVKIKRIVAIDPKRDQRKAIKDAMQADIVEELIKQYQLTDSLLEIESSGLEGAAAPKERASHP